jgi:hypothetical protein
LYAATFEKFQLFFKENESLDLEALKQEEPGESALAKAHLTEITRPVVFWVSVWWCSVTPSVDLKRLTRQRQDFMHIWYFPWNPSFSFLCARIPVSGKVRGGSSVTRGPSVEVAVRPVCLVKS